MKRLWDSKKFLGNLEPEGEGCGIIMEVTPLLLLEPFYTIQTQTHQTFLGECITNSKAKVLWEVFCKNHHLRFVLCSNNQFRKLFWPSQICRIYELYLINPIGTWLWVGSSVSKIGSNWVRLTFKRVLNQVKSGWSSDSRIQVNFRSGWTGWPGSFGCTTL